MNLNIDHDLFRAEQIDQVAVIRFRQNLIRRFTDLSLKEGLFKYLREASANDGIKVVLCLGNPNKIKRDEIVDFFKECTVSAATLDHLSRLYNAINQLVLLVRDINKIVIHADDGEILPLFFNIGLACDYRILGDKAVLQHPLLELGMVPKGGGIFFMAQKLGTSKTLDLLLSGEDIDAGRALDLGLVDKVIPSQTLQASALEIAAKVADKPRHYICGVKRLLSMSSERLENFLDRENEQLLECIKSGDFKQLLDSCRIKSEQEQDETD